MQAPTVAMDTELFIQDVFARPVIWMVKHPHHKNKVRVKKQWDDLRRKYPDVSVDDLKKRWKNLKDTFRKELKRLPQAKPGVPAENFRSGWRYFESLSFLRDELCFAGKDLVDAEGSSPSQHESDKFSSTPNHAPASPASSVKTEDDPLHDAPAGASKRKDPREVREEFLRIEQKKMKILEEEIARTNEYMKSDNYHFLMSLLPEMDKLPPVQKMRLRAKISQAVFDEVSLSMYGDQHSYAEVQQVHFQEAPSETVIEIKEEAINMYE